MPSQRLHKCLRNECTINSIKWCIQLKLWDQNPTVVCKFYVCIDRSMCIKQRLTKQTISNQHILNVYITIRWLPIVSLILKLIRHHDSCCSLIAIRQHKLHAANTNQSNRKTKTVGRQINRMKIVLALCWIPCLKIFSLKMKYSLGCCISIIIKACTKNGKYLGVSACFSLRISAMYISGGISIE